MPLRRLRGLIALQEAIAGADRDILSVAKVIVAERSAMPQADGAIVEFREEDMLRVVAASGTSTELLGLSIPIEASLSGKCIQTGEPQRCDNWDDDPRVSRAYRRKFDLKSMIVIPILRKGETAAVLKYHSSRPAAFDHEDLLFARLLAAPIGAALSRIAEADAERIGNELRDILRLKEQLVSTVSHELRTPLTSIAGSLSLLNAGAAGEVPEAARGLVAIAARNADRLRSLVDDLLDLDRIDSGRLGLNPEHVDLCEVLSEVVEANQPFALNLGVSLAAELPGAPLLITTDPGRLGQIVTNLISNAAKFSPPGSAVSLSLDQHEGRARIRVADQGPGIPAEFRARLFQRFTQSETTRGRSGLPGTGLGLAIARGLAEQLGGSLRLDESAAIGATFEVQLPFQAAFADA